MGLNVFQHFIDSPPYLLQYFTGIWKTDQVRLKDVMGYMAMRNNTSGVDL